MQRAREKSRQHADGKVATVSALAAAMQPHVNFLVTAGLRVYSGISFGHDMHTDELEKASNLLFSLLEIDGRGGYFTQATMRDALREAVGRENMTDNMNRHDSRLLHSRIKWVCGGCMVGRKHNHAD